jgi:hypothetical protein
VTSSIPETYDAIRFVSASWMRGEKHGVLVSGMYGVPVVYVCPIVYSLLLSDTEAMVKSLRVKPWKAKKLSFLEPREVLYVEP